MSGQGLTKERIFPVQVPRLHRAAGIPEPVYKAAYEVYCHVWGAQPAMVDLDRGCRGGFTVGEIVCFLYARAFPKSEWRARVEEAERGAIL